MLNYFVSTFGLYTISHCVIFWPYVAACGCGRTSGAQLKFTSFLHCCVRLLSLLMKWHSRNILVAYATHYEMCWKLDWHPVWRALWPSDLTYKALWSFSLGYLEFNISAFFYLNICGQLTFFSYELELRLWSGRHLKKTQNTQNKCKHFESESYRTVQFSCLE